MLSKKEAQYAEQCDVLYVDRETDPHQQEYTVNDLEQEISSYL